MIAPKAPYDQTAEGDAMRQDTMKLTPEQEFEVQAMFARYAFTGQPDRPNPTLRHIAVTLAVTLIASVIGAYVLRWLLA